MELWQALYLNPVTIGELAENILNKDYKEISIKRVKEKIMVVLTFEDEGETARAGYLFDREGNLLHAEMVEGEGKERSSIFDKAENVQNTLEESIMRRKRG